MWFSLSRPLGNFEMQKKIIQINEQVPTSLDLDLELEMWSLVKIYHYMDVSDSYFVYCL